MTATADWISGALDALDNVGRAVEELRQRIERLSEANRTVARELPQAAEDPDLRMLLRHAIVGSQARAVDAMAALPDWDVALDPASPEDVRDAAARLLDRLEQRRLEAQRWRGLAERFRETVDDETWRGLLEEYGLQDDDLDPST